jgi:hypothetical protein
MTALLERPAPSVRTALTAAAESVASRSVHSPAPAHRVAAARLADLTLTTEQYNAALAAYLRGAQPIGM